MKPPRLLVVADIGGPGHYHLGDEAMVEANLRMFRGLVPNIKFTLTSRDPPWTSARYDVESLRTPVFPSRNGSSAWAARLGDEIAQSLRDADGLVVSGGGNLCRTWPEKIVERSALIEYAKELGRPVVILGQTLGPDLSVDQRRLLGGTLPAARWLGVRDESSAALAIELGVSADRVHRQLDDAFFLEAEPVEDSRAEPLRREGRPWILVTLDASFASPAMERPLSVIASQLDALADALNAALVFVPHVGGADVPAADADATAGQALGA